MGRVCGWFTGLTNAIFRLKCSKCGIIGEGLSEWGRSMNKPSYIVTLIEVVMQRAQRDLRRPVLPREVQPRLPIDRAEGSLRRDMYAMYQSGRLVRVGGEGARQGYRLPTKIERLSYQLNGGRWPHGTERVAWVN